MNVIENLFLFVQFNGNDREGYARTSVRDTKTRNTDAKKSACVDDVP